MASRDVSWSRAISRSRASPSPLHDEPSTTRRSAEASRSWAAREVNGGSPGHQTVVGRSWTMSGVTMADRCRPASPPAVSWMVSAQISGASARGSTQCASTWASIHDGPSGSADWTTIVREGWRPVRAWIVDAARSAISGRRAMTTRFMTLVRAAIWRPGAPSPRTSSTVRSWLAQMRASSFSISSMLWARADQRRTGSARVIAGAAEMVMASVAGTIRSGAIDGPRGPAARRPRAGPTSRRRSSGRSAAARPPRHRRWGRRCSTPPRPRRPG